MKLFYILIAAALTLVNVTSARNSASDKGIQFFQATWQQALQKAREENKPVFLDIYAAWCGPCKLLDRHTFSDNSVGTYYNAHFINVSLDGEQGEGEALATKYAIRGYPTLLFLDKNGSLIWQDAGYRGPKDFIKTGKAALAATPK